MTCAFHPEREALLRCNRCEKPICTQCSVHTPTGYRCKECIKGQRAKFITAEWHDPLRAGLVSLTIGFLGAVGFSLLAPLFGWFSFIALIFLGPAIGGGIARAVRWAVERRRGPTIAYAAVAGLVIATSPFLLFGIISFFMGNFWALLYPVAYLGFAGSILWRQLRGLVI